MGYVIRDLTTKKFVFAITQRFSFDFIYLFGSTARQDDRIDSDIDIALILPEKQITLTLKAFINELITNLAIDKQILINWILITKEDWEKQTIPLIKVIITEGVLLWEKEKII